MELAMSDTYDHKFYQQNYNGSLSSARAVVPLMKDLVGPRSVLDVGCGSGTWASVWIASGIDDVVGVDGAYVSNSILNIPVDRFVAHDLTRPLGLGRRFDLVTCLEVAEHLPAESSGTIVQSLTAHSDVVAFSAAVPRQGGTNHINLMWPSQWAALFKQFGYTVYDPFRPLIWDNSDVEFWYRQNTLLFVAEHSELAERLSAPTGPLDIVHPDLLESWARPSAKYLALRGRLLASRPGRIARMLRSALPIS
ncbi:MAG: class I SAM-dependent methyltransferase [Mycobacterium sp.]|nr:class I SAM-dependent methyltransferase [Mycobacterium sp.]